MGRHPGFGVAEAVDVGVGGEKAVDVAERAEKLPLRLHQAAARELQVLPGRVARHEVPPHDVGAVLGYRGEGVDGVPLRLRHLRPVLGQEQPVDDDVLVGHRVLDERGDGVEGVEPPPRLVHPLGDEVGGEVGLELFFVFEGVVPLRERHGPAVEPDVDEVLDAAHGPPAFFLRGGPRDDVDERAVEVDLARLGVGGLVGERAAHLLAQLLDRADHLNVVGVLVARPDRERGAPVAAARERPVDVVPEPLAKAPGANGFRLPVDAFVQLDQPLLVRRRADEPALDGVAHERRALAPVVGVVVEKGLVAVEEAALAEVARDRFVGVLEPLPLDQRRLLGKRPVRRDRIEERQPLGLGHLEVVGAEGGRHVDDAGAVLGRDEVRRHHPPRRVFSQFLSEVRIRRLIRPPYQLPPHEPLHHLNLFFNHLQPLLRQNQVFLTPSPILPSPQTPFPPLSHSSSLPLFSSSLLLLFPQPHLHITDVRPDGEGRIRDERPRRRRPGEEGRLGFVAEGETNIHAGVLDLLIT